MAFITIIIFTTRASFITIIKLHMLSKQHYFYIQNFLHGGHKKVLDTFEKYYGHGTQLIARP